jgi:hypothetical protein
VQQAPGHQALGISLKGKQVSNDENTSQHDPYELANQLAWHQPEPSDERTMDLGGYQINVLGQRWALRIQAKGNLRPVSLDDKDWSLIHDANGNVVTYMDQEGAERQGKPFWASECDDDQELAVIPVSIITHYSRVGLEAVLRERDERNQRISQLEAALERSNGMLRTAQAQADAAWARHRDDVRKIGAALLEEASERNWCEDYDEWVAKLNPSLSVRLEEREREFNVEVHLETWATREVLARNREEAEAKATDLDMGEAIDLARQGIRAHRWQVEVQDDDD